MKFIKVKKHTMVCFTQNKIPGGLMGREDPNPPIYSYIMRQVHT